MKVAGIVIDELKKVAILSSAKENGYANRVMITYIKNGEIVYQSVFLNTDTIGIDLLTILDSSLGYKWKTTLKKHSDNFVDSFIKNLISRNG
jgi:hypothetical protein